MTIHRISPLLRAAVTSIALFLLVSATVQIPARAEENGQWVLWKGSDQPLGERMYLFCVQNGQRVIDLSGLKSFSEYVLDGKVNRVRFKYNQDTDDTDAYRILNVTPMAGTVCEWGMADQ
jgi:hypothetical protein